MAGFDLGQPSRAQPEQNASLQLNPISSCSVACIPEGQLVSLVEWDVEVGMGLVILAFEFIKLWFVRTPMNGIHTLGCIGWSFHGNGSLLCWAVLCLKNRGPFVTGHADSDVASAVPQKLTAAS